MSPRQLLEKLESLGSIDEKVLGKIRKEIQNPDKTVKPKAVLSYLVKKGQLTKKQASVLLKTPTADEIEVVEPLEKEYDTNDLMGVGPEEVVEPIVEPIPDSGLEPVVLAEDDLGETIMDDGLLVDDLEEVAVVEPDIVAPIEDLPTEVVHEVTPVTSPLDADMDGFGTDGFESTQPAASTESRVSTFVGKRNQKDQWATKWLYIGFGILGTLAIGLVVLYLATSGQTAEDMYEAASTSFNNQSWGDATEKYEAYLERCLLYTSPSPRDKRQSRMPSSA